MPELSAVDLIGRLLLSALFGGFIGLERESHGRPAGLRTHLLVAMGSCLVMLLSVYGFAPSWTRDPARLAAQVISGIGFLGAGTILREGITVKGLTTAASLWVVAGIGLAIGSGFYLGAVVTTALAVMSLFFLEKLEKRYISPRALTLEAEIEDRPGQLGTMCSAIGLHGLSIRHIEMERDGETGTVVVIVQVEGRQANPAALLDDLRRLQGMHRLKWR
ncbi:MAG: MgtC/SapB family protein [Patescibacteria group bacterium]